MHTQFDKEMSVQILETRAKQKFSFDPVLLNYPAQ